MFTYILHGGFMQELETQKNAETQAEEIGKFLGSISEDPLARATFSSKILKSMYKDNSYGIAWPSRTLTSGLGLEYINHGNDKWSIAVINPRTGKTGVAEIQNTPDGIKFNPKELNDSAAMRKELDKAVVEAYNKTGVAKLNYDDKLLIGKAVPNPSGGTDLIDARRPPKIPAGEFERITMPSAQGEQQLGARFFLNDGTGRMTMALEKKIGDAAPEMSQHHFKVSPSGTVVHRVGSKDIKVGEIGRVPVDPRGAIRLDEISSEQMILLKSIALGSALKTTASI